MATDDTHSLIEQRKAKLAALRAKGIDPFRNKFTPTEKCAQARANYVEGREVAVAGRITAHRDMGKSMFLDVRDESGRLQVYAQKNVLGDEQFDIFRHLDLGDFMGARGTLFTTKTGEISVRLTSFVILAKALRPPPEKWHGLADTEIRYRQRYLDLMASPEVTQVFLKRSQIIREMRNFLNDRGYVEVETPMMQAIPGGAAAQPFKTYHNALGCDFYLRIALELSLKRLLVGGMDKVFEIGRNFRNEGLSPRHNPEFTMLEAYQAYGDYRSMMELVRGIICHVAERVLHSLRIPRPVKRALERNLQSAIDVLTDLAKKSVIGTRLVDDTQIETALNGFNGAFWPLLKELRGLRDGLDAPECNHHAIAHTAQQICDKARLMIMQFRARSSTGLPTDLRAKNMLEAFNRMDRVVDVLGTLRVAEIDLALWHTKEYKDLVRAKVREKTEGQVTDWFAESASERRRIAIEHLGLEGDITAGYEDFEVTGAVFEKLIEHTLIQPTFVTHLPKELVPLAKVSPEDPSTVEVFECCINGQEISPAYTEQNDPIEQRERLEHQAGGEQQKLDEDFLVALEHGMPPAGGMGMGIDRLCMMLLGQESIRDVILFPQLRPK